MRSLLVIALMVFAVGCQEQATWQNPFAPFGPATVPPPGMQGPPGTYYPAPAGAVPGMTVPTTTPPTITLPAASTRPSLGSDTRSAGGISLVPAKPSASTSLGSDMPERPSTRPSFAGNGAEGAEGPIRIVEAQPQSGGSSFSTSSSRDQTQPSVVQARPGGDASTTGTPARFNSGNSAAELSQLPRPGIQATPNSPAINRTRGFIPSAPAKPATTPGGRQSQRSQGSFRSDPSVAPISYEHPAPAFRDATGDASGQWRTRP